MIKYKTYALFSLIIVLCTITFASAKEPILKNKTIYLDAGHGGRDPGAIYKELKESEINLQITQKLKKELENSGAKVYMTRNGDYDLSKQKTNNHKKNDLSERARIINESNCDMYISIHLNSDNSPTWNGSQIFYTTKNIQNKKIAEIMQKKFKENIKQKREIKQLKNMYMFDRIIKPGILIEVGFISNPGDRYKLTQDKYQIEITQTIKEAIEEYFINN